MSDFHTFIEYLKTDVSTVKKLDTLWKQSEFKAKYNVQNNTLDPIGGNMQF